MQDKEFLKEVLENVPNNISAGLSLVKMEIESTNYQEALNILIKLWKNTHDEKVGDILADLSQKIVNDFKRERNKDSEVINRIVRIIQIVLDSNKITIDSLQYNIIGGLALDAYSLIPIFKNKNNNLIKEKNIIFFSGNSANPALVDILSRQLPILQSPEFPKSIPFSFFDWDSYSYKFNKEFAEEFFGRHSPLVEQIIQFQPSTCANSYSEEKEEENSHLLNQSLLTFNEAEEKKGEAFLRNVLKRPENGWFVCIYARDGGYYNETTQNPNHFRNAEIDSYIPAVEDIIRRGGYVVRIGSATNKKLNYSSNFVFDYSASEYNDPFLDIYLISKCRFLIGTPSGYTHVALPFKVPQLLVNSINCFGGKCDLWIPKKMIDTKTNQSVRFSDFMNRYYGANNLGLLAENGVNQEKIINIKYIDNTPEEILSATTEMFNRMENNHIKDLQVESIKHEFQKEWLKWKRPFEDTNIASSFISSNKELFKVND